MENNKNILHKNSMINEILINIKHYKDFDFAARLIISNQISMSYLTANTIKITPLELAKLTDQIIQKY